VDDESDSADWWCEFPDAVGASARNTLSSIGRSGSSSRFEDQLNRAIADLLTSKDADRDGKLSLAELGGDSRVFAKFDVDGDGKLTVTNCAAGMRRKGWDPVRRSPNACDEVVFVPTIFESLFASIEEEIKRQEEVLAATRAQGVAARNRDMKALEKETAVLMSLAQEAAHADAARMRLVRQILGVSAHTGATLSDVIALAPEPLASRLREMRTRLQTLLHAIREETRANTAVMRLSLKIVGAP